MLQKIRIIVSLSSGGKLQQVNKKFDAIKKEPKYSEKIGQTGIFPGLVVFGGFQAG